MKKKIIFASVLSVFILMLLPSIPAVEYDVAIKANETSFIDRIQNINMAEFKEKIQNMDIHEFREKIKNIDARSAIEELKEISEDNSAQPQCVILFITLIVLLKVFGTIIGLIFAAVGVIVDIIGILLVKIVALAFAILKPIIKLTVLGLMAYFTIAAIIDLSFLCFFLLLIILTGGS